jgi:hypothetical protein
MTLTLLLYCTIILFLVFNMKFLHKIKNTLVILQFIIFVTAVINYKNCFGSEKITWLFSIIIYQLIILVINQNYKDFITSMIRNFKLLINNILSFVLIQTKRDQQGYENIMLNPLYISKKYCSDKHNPQDPLVEFFTKLHDKATNTTSNKFKRNFYKGLMYVIFVKIATINILRSFFLTGLLANIIRVNFIVSTSIVLISLSVSPLETKLLTLSSLEVKFIYLMITSFFFGITFLILESLGLRLGKAKANNPKMVFWDSYGRFVPRKLLSRSFFFVKVPSTAKIVGNFCLIFSIIYLFMFLLSIFIKIFF